MRFQRAGPVTWWDAPIKMLGGWSRSGRYVLSTLALVGFFWPRAARSDRGVRRLVMIAALLQIIAAQARGIQYGVVSERYLMIPAGLSIPWSAAGLMAMARYAGERYGRRATSGKFELRIIDIFRFNDGRTVFVGPATTEPGLLRSCRCLLFVNGVEHGAIHIEGEMLPNPSNQSGHRSVSTREPSPVNRDMVLSSDCRLICDTPEYNLATNSPSESIVTRRSLTVAALIAIAPLAYYDLRPARAGAGWEREAGAWIAGQSKPGDVVLAPHQNSAVAYYAGLERRWPEGVNLTQPMTRPTAVWVVDDPGMSRLTDTDKSTLAICRMYLHEDEPLRAWETEGGREAKVYRIVSGPTWETLRKMPPSESAKFLKGLL